MRKVVPQDYLKDNDPFTEFKTSKKFKGIYTYVINEKRQKDNKHRIQDSEKKKEFRIVITWG